MLAERVRKKKGVALKHFVPPVETNSPPKKRENMFCISNSDQ